MRIDWWTLALQTINVLILVWLLARFLFRPVMAAIAARRAAADKLLADAQAAKEAAAAQAAALEAQNHAFEAETERRRSEMCADIEEERTRLLDQAKAEAETLTKQASAAAQAERARMAAELEGKAGVLAGRMAEKLVQRLPVAETTEAMFKALLDRVGALPQEERRKLAADAPLTIVTPAPVEAAIQARYVQALTVVLPGAIAPAFTVDSALIAGFELHGPHSLVRNSWRADLDDLLAALKEDDHARLG